MDLGVGLCLLIENTPAEGKLARELPSHLAESQKSGDM
jgi:hypothetical protein